MMVRQAILHVMPSSLVSLVFCHSPMVCGSTGRNYASHLMQPDRSSPVLFRAETLYPHHARPWSTLFQPLGATMGQCEVGHPPLSIFSETHILAGALRYACFSFIRVIQYHIERIVIRTQNRLVNSLICSVLSRAQRRTDAKKFLLSTNSQRQPVSRFGRWCYAVGPVLWGLALRPVLWI